jgi:hypothetical protein
MRGANVPKPITWRISVNPEGEQPIEKDDDMTVDDYSEKTVTVQAENSKTVDIESSSENPVWLLAIEPLDVVDQPEDALTCKFSGGPDVRLDRLVVFSGELEWSLLGGAPDGVEFTNNTENPINVKVTLGTKAAAGAPSGHEDDSRATEEAAEETTTETTARPVMETFEEGRS